MIDVMIIPLAGIALPVIIVPIAAFAKHVGNKRHYAHLERMESIKAGIVPPPPASMAGPGAIVAIGAGVPGLSLLGALAATLSIPWHSDDVVPLVGIIWFAAMLLGLGGLMTALILGILRYRADRLAATNLGDRRMSAKPAYDPDMFESAGRGY